MIHRHPHPSRATSLLRAEGGSRAKSRRYATPVSWGLVHTMASTQTVSIGANSLHPQRPSPGDLSTPRHQHKQSASVPTVCILNARLLGTCPHRGIRANSQQSVLTVCIRNARLLGTCPHHSICANSLHPQRLSPGDFFTPWHQREESASARPVSWDLSTPRHRHE